MQKVDLKDSDGCTPLHLACYNGHSKNGFSFTYGSRKC